MERLTKRELINGKYIGCNIKIGQMNSCPDCNDSCMYGTCKWQEKANQKLKEYEDLEEQGLLLKLPCKVGTEVYCISEIRCKHYLSKDCWNCLGNEFANACYEPERKIEKCAFTIEMLDDFGKTVFLTKAEAEKALAEMKE